MSRQRETANTLTEQRVKLLGRPRRRPERMSDSLGLGAAVRGGFGPFGGQAVTVDFIAPHTGSMPGALSCCMWASKAIS